MSHSTSMNRRNFLKLGALGAAATAVGGGALAGAQETAAAPAATAELRTLGRTGLKISVVSLGAMRTQEPGVMQAAFDRGVNYVDTARGYMDGRNEEYVGQALKGYRDKVFLATKTKGGSAEDIVASAETSLKALQQDYVDILQLHGLSSKDQVMNPAMREGLAKLRDQGKIRFVGLTTHKNEADVLNAVVDDPDKFFDTVLVTYSFKSAPAIKEAIARAATAGVGVIAMKTQAGGYETAEMGGISPHQAALKFVLQDTNVTAAIPSMVDLAQVKEDTEVMGMMKLTRVDRQILQRYETAIAPYFCTRCDRCAPTCPKGVDISSVNRCLMYAEGYRDLGLARANFAELPASASALACGDCDACVARCANGLDIGEKMQRARALLV